MAVELLQYPILYNDASLKAYYRMESGALTTDSKGSYTLTNNNTVSSATGKFGGAADFGSSNTNKSLRVVTDFGLTSSSAQSIAIWVKLNAEIASGTWNLLENMWANTTTVAALGIQYQYNGGSRRLRFYRNGNTNGEILNTVTLGTSDWNQLVITYDGTNIKGYVNKTSIGSSPSSGVITAGGYASGLSLGALNPVDNTNYASILLDDVPVFAKELSSTEIADYYDAVPALSNWFLFM